ncbi:bifunctional 3-(3-hydroxy-phenyl)propionate/3-hydroxycinnamic acid hydroxylase [Bradyrhizobium sp. LB11.1]|uniref:bifunctional 3-(3-hydroxy-phenyl)propionate/3-hydroxycinnamic acid hydroxylase n=1 Tax=Bradyrhizobium sp. LB11.1 TaxID=3156326 RepID=UPI003392FCE3
MDANKSELYDVAVVGCGPVGLVLARLLGSKGIRVAAIDPNRLVCHHPRATHLDDETMRTLQTVGAAAMELQFLRMSGWTLRKRDGTPFLTFAHSEEESDQGWQGDYQFHQPDFESQLRGGLANDPHVDLLFGWEVTDLRQADEEVVLTLRDRKSGDTRALRAAYAVGCDGAGSFVRRSMAADVEDLKGTQRSLIIDIYPFEHPEGLPRTSGFIVCRQELPLTYVPIFPPMLRFEFMLSGGDSAHELERPSSIYKLLSPWIAAGGYRIMRTDTYEWHARLVKGWRNGRVLLAGDAAHEMPPMLGQGMCSGLRDALNLAWKLASVVKGECHSTLLDTYETERAAHVRPYIVESARQSNLIEGFGSGDGLPEVTEPQVVPRMRPSLGVGLADHPTRSIGQLAPQPRSSDGARLDDVTGYNFVILGAKESIAAVDDNTRSLWSRLGAVVSPGTGDRVDKWLAANGADVAIVRPDRYVYALCSGPNELIAATRKLSERLFRAEAMA